MPCLPVLNDQTLVQIQLPLKMLYNNKKNMKLNKINFAHKNRLILFSKLNQQHEEKHQTMQLCSTGFSFSKQLSKNSLNSKEKQPKKHFANQNVRESQEKSKNSLKIRSFSTNIQPKILSSISNIQLQKKQLRTKQPNINGTLQSKISQLVDQLKKKFIIFQNHLASYTIKKDHFQNLLYSLVKNTFIKKNQALDQDLASFTKFFQAISKSIVEERREVLKQKLEVTQSVIQHTVLRDNYIQETLQKKSQIEKLMQSKTSLVEEISHMQTYKVELIKQVQQKQAQMHEDLKVIESNKMQKKTGEKELQMLKMELDNCKIQVAKIKQTSTQIYNFVGSQANKLIAMASEEYKNIESQIYEYAAYLQCNQLASSLTYEPLNITCLTQNLQEQLKTINRTIVQNEEMSAKEKGKLMRDFLIEWMNRYKKKDDQQKEFINFKTKCVQNFIQKMQKWLDNWTLKQEYLVGLRDQFALDTIRMNALLAQLSSQPYCQECSSCAKPILANLAEVYAKIDNNYKLGNSFY